MKEKHRLKRTARFTSSKIVALTASGRGKDSIGAPFYTYCEEKRIERKMGCSITEYAHSRAGAWGQFMELVAYDYYGYEYRMVSADSIIHPDEEFQEWWSGACDFIVPEKKVSELKSYYRKKFAQYTDCILQKNVELFKKNFPQEYWQIVSNAILNQVDLGEAVSFMPRRKDYKAIKEMVDNLDSPHQWKYKFISDAEMWELPFLPNDSGYESFNAFEFKVPQQDKDFLIERVRLAIAEVKKYE